MASSGSGVSSRAVSRPRQKCAYVDGKVKFLLSDGRCRPGTIPWGHGAMGQHTHRFPPETLWQLSVLHDGSPAVMPEASTELYHCPAIKWIIGYYIIFWPAPSPAQRKLCVNSNKKARLFKAGFHAVSTRGSGRGIPNCFCRDFYFLPERFATKLASMGVRKEVIITEAATCAVAIGATAA